MDLKLRAGGGWRVCVRELKMVSILVRRAAAHLYTRPPGKFSHSRETMETRLLSWIQEPINTARRVCRCVISAAYANTLSPRRRDNLAERRSKWGGRRLILRERDWLNPQTECWIKNARGRTVPAGLICYTARLVITREALIAMCVFVGQRTTAPAIN